MVEPAKARGPGRPRKTEVQQQTVALIQSRDKPEEKVSGTAGHQNTNGCPDLNIKNVTGGFAPDIRLKEPGEGSPKRLPDAIPHRWVDVVNGTKSNGDEMLQINENNGGKQTPT
ncbi:unnamed protein product [Amaranthus hypochondriacus]